MSTSALQTFDYGNGLTATAVPTERASFTALVDMAARTVETCRASVRRSAMDYVAAGRALRDVKDRLLNPAYLHQDRDNGQFTVMDNVSITGEKGWVELCKDRLGISYKTADRYIADWEAYRLLAQEARQLPRAREYLDAVRDSGIRATAALRAFEQYKAIPEVEEIVDPSRWAGLEARCRTQAELVRFKEMERAALSGDSLAANQLEQAAKGHIPIMRAYAGWRGGEATKDKSRRDPDYVKLAIKSATTFYNAWKHYATLPMEVRHETSKAIVEVMTAADVPDEVGREIYRRLADRYGE